MPRTGRWNGFTPKPRARSTPGITARRSSITSFSKPASRSAFTGNSHCWTWPTPTTRRRSSIRPSQPATRFIRLYPQNTHVDYAYFLKGLVNFNRGKGLTERFLPIDASQRDQSSALTAFQAFSELLERYPQSQYAEDAKKRMVFLRNRLARHEIHVASYYMKRGAYLAAVNRAKNVVESYPRTPSVPDAPGTHGQGLQGPGNAGPVRGYPACPGTELSGPSRHLRHQGYRR